MTRARTLIATLLVLCTLALLMVATDLGAGSGRGEAVETVLADLTAQRLALETARDSTDQQIALAQHLLGWLEGTDEAGSTELVYGLGRLLESRRPSTGLVSVAELAATGQLRAVEDAEVRARLLALDRRLSAPSSSANLELERYRVRLEETLSPGMWRYVFLGETGEYPVDFRAALRDLHAQGFDRTLRSLLRGLREQRSELDTLAHEAAGLESKLVAGAGASGQ